MSRHNVDTARLGQRVTGVADDNILHRTKTGLVACRIQIVSTSPPLQSEFRISFRSALGISGRTPTVREGTVMVAFSPRRATSHDLAQRRIEAQDLLRQLMELAQAAAVR
jgi:hypothetical protein